MKKMFAVLALVAAIGLLPSSGDAAFWQSTKVLTPQGGELRIPVQDISDGKARFFKVKADDGTMVTFFVVKSRDGVVRAAINACDECYKAGKGYVQEGDVMVCENCGRRFATDKINVIAGGCNPVGVDRKVQAGHLIIGMKEINQKSWYCKTQKQ
ncbi:MAG: DUF2318 domain-containing protein [Deltaproteobacteria bacterium]